MDASRCLRTEKHTSHFGQIVERKLVMKNAKEECSRNRTCVGIEANVGDTYYKLCLYAIYTSTAYDKYGDVRTILYKKVERQGEYNYKYFNSQNDTCPKLVKYTIKCC